MKYSCGHKKGGPDLTVNFPCIDCKVSALREKIRNEGALSLTTEEQWTFEAGSGESLEDYIEPEDAYDIPGYKGPGF